jgi:hypothetical protein
MILIKKIIYATPKKDQWLVTIRKSKKFKNINKKISMNIVDATGITIHIKNTIYIFLNIIGSVFFCLIIVKLI